MKILLATVRIVVGVLFIFSGLIKLNDPMGLSYKMQEFFEVWGLNFLDNYALAFALVMNTFEIVAGVAILTGWRMKLFIWLLLLLIIFFTFLTGYALFSGKIKTCGCFGDCIPLTAAQSFMKDLLLLLLIVFIFAKKESVKPIFKGAVNVAIIAVAVVFCVVSQGYVLKHLPLVDCLPYRVGNNLPDQMKMPEGALADSFAITFKYRKAGKEMEFDAEHFPDDFNDSAYQFVDRIQELVRPATGAAAISEFVLNGDSGEDTTAAILSQNGYYVMLLTKNANETEAGWSKNAAEVSAACSQKHIPFFVVTSTTESARQQLAPGTGIVYLRCDATVIKTAGRVNPTYLLMKQATVVGKYANADYQKAMKQIISFQ